MAQQHWMITSGTKCHSWCYNQVMQSGPAFQRNWAYYTKRTPDLIPRCHPDYKGRHHLSPEALGLYTSNLGWPKQIPGRFLFENLTLPLAEWLDSSLSHGAWVTDPAVSSLVRAMSSFHTHPSVHIFVFCFASFNGRKLIHTHCGENSRKESEALLYCGSFACIITW